MFFFVLSSVFSHNLGKSDLEESPGLVAILCIFIIVVTLVLVVATVRCIRSPRSNFERLEDVPMVSHATDGLQNYKHIYKNWTAEILLSAIIKLDKWIKFEMTVK